MTMASLLSRFLPWFRKDEPVEKKTDLVHRLRCACARETVEHERGATGAYQTLPEQPPARRNPAKPARDTRLDVSSLEETPFVAPQKRPVLQAPSLLQRLRSWFKGKAPPRDDRRARPRVPFGQLHRQLKMLVGPSTWPAKVTDISRTGVGLVLGLRQPPGTTLRLKIVDESRAIHCTMQARVVRIDLLPD